MRTLALLLGTLVFASCVDPPRVLTTTTRYGGAKGSHVYGAQTYSDVDFEAPVGILDKPGARGLPTASYHR